MARRRWVVPQPGDDGEPSDRLEAAEENAESLASTPAPRPVSPPPSGRRRKKGHHTDQASAGSPLDAANEQTAGSATPAADRARGADRGPEDARPPEVERRLRPVRHVVAYVLLIGMVLGITRGLAVIDGESDDEGGVMASNLLAGVVVAFGYWLVIALLVWGARRVRGRSENYGLVLRMEAILITVAIVAALSAAGSFVTVERNDAEDRADGPEPVLASSDAQDDESDLDPGQRNILQFINQSVRCTEKHAGGVEEQEEHAIAPLEDGDFALAARRMNRRADDLDSYRVCLQAVVDEIDDPAILAPARRMLEAVASIESTWRNEYAGGARAENVSRFEIGDKRRARATRKFEKAQDELDAVYDRRGGADALGEYLDLDTLERLRDEAEG